MTTATAASSTAAAATTQAAEAPPADVPSFLARFCDHRAREDVAYVNAHTRLKDYDSEQGPDPEAAAGERGRVTWSGGPPFAGTCKRIAAQPPGVLATRIREENGLVLVRLRGEGKASDLVIERNGADYLLIKEVKPGRATKQKARRGSGGGGADGHDGHGSH